MRTVLSLAVVLILAAVASADEILLENGGKLVGRATRIGDDVVVTTPTGEFRVPASQVKSITEGRTVWDDYDEKVRAADLKDAKAQLELGDWCKQKGLTSEGRKHWKKAIEIDPDQADARARLGYIRYEDRWLTNDEYYKARGFVNRGGEWIPEDEARRRDADKLQKAAFDKHVKTIRSSLTKLSSMKRKTRAEGKLELQKYAESIGDTRLGSFATEVATYMNSYWKSYREALALVEVRATMATLKRPIPTITTSLGAFTTPVTIQLPEVSVVSVKTTVLVPADIELDEDE
jgi:tetratricopeptide (TPR) repeat protein